MPGSFSEDYLKNFQDLVQFSEGMPEAYDFTRCVRTDGTYYGSRGLCVPPNKPAQPAAPKPVSKGLTQAERSAFIAGGGNVAGMKGKSIDETIAQGKKILGAGRTAGQVPGNRLTTAEQSAYQAGGGNAAGMRGKSIGETIAQGKKNLARMDQGAGRTASSLTQPAPQRAPQAAAKPAAPQKPQAAANSAGKPLSTAERAAYKAGGGNAAGMKGKSIDETVAQGRKNLERMTPAERSAYASGGGNAAVKKKGQSIDEVIAQGKKNLERTNQGGGRVPGSKLTTAEQAAYKAGGGNAASMKGKSIDEVIAQGKKNLDRADSSVGRSPIPRGETGGLTEAERSAFKAGGGNAAGMKGKSIDEVIAQGRKNLKKATYG